MSAQTLRMSCMLLILSGCASVETKSRVCDNVLQPLVLTPLKDLNNHSDQESHCTIDERNKTMTCDHKKKALTIPDLKEPGPTERTVYYQVPKSKKPADGFPVVFIFHGWSYPAHLNWRGSTEDPHGGWWQVMTTKVLLDNGYAVITPDAYFHELPFWDSFLDAIISPFKDNWRAYWDTNISPFDDQWQEAPDHHFMTALIKKIEEGTFGDLDPDSLYATGISSGGYMTSRMAISSYSASNFRALAINSASYATCMGGKCDLPDDLPDHHPPMLFLHGEKDRVVPMKTMIKYDDLLVKKRVETRTVCDPKAGHEWLAASPEEILHWFKTHPKDQ